MVFLQCWTDCPFQWSVKTLYHTVCYRVIGCFMYMLGIHEFFINALYRWDSNWRPLSVVILIGASNLHIQVVVYSYRAFVTVMASMFFIGYASSYRVYMSMQVRQYLQPYDNGISMISICSCSKRPACWNWRGGVDTCLVIFDFWHGIHVFVHSRQSVLKPGDMNRLLANFAVLLRPGCESWCTVWNAALLKSFMTKGLTASVDTSQYRFNEFRKISELVYASSKNFV